MPNKKSRSVLIIPVLILSLPTYQIRWSIVGIPTTFLEIVIFGLALICISITSGSIVKRLRTFVILEDQLLQYAVAVFVAATTLAAVFSPSTLAAAGIWKAYVIDPIIVFYILRWSIRERLFSWDIVIDAVSILCIGIGLVSLMQWFTPQGISIGSFHYFPITEHLWASKNTFRAISVFAYPNAVALLISPLLLLLCSEIPKRRPFPVLGFVVGGLAIFLSASLGGMIATSMGLIAFAGLRIRAQKKYLAASGLSILILAGVFLVSHKSLLQKLELKTYSGTLRQQQYTETFQLFHDHPLMGGGLANYQNAILPYHNTKKSGAPFLYPHNFLLATWSEFGLLGLFAMLSLLLLVAKRLHFHWQEYRSIITASLISAWITLLTHGMVDVPYFKNDLSVLFWILVALSTVSPTLLDRQEG